MLSLHSHPRLLLYPGDIGLVSSEEALMVLSLLSCLASPPAPPKVAPPSSIVPASVPAMSSSGYILAAKPPLAARDTRLGRACRWLRGSQPAPHPVIRESLASGRHADTQSKTRPEGKNVWSLECGEAGNLCSGPPPFGSQEAVGQASRRADARTWCIGKVKMPYFISWCSAEAGSSRKWPLCFSAPGMPGCPCSGCGMAGQRLLFLAAVALELLGGAGGSQQALRSRGAAAACRLDNKESESWGALLSGERLDTWICSLLGSLMVGLSGVFPLLVIPLEMGTTLRSEAGARRLKQLLSFALGGLLGNVFLHLLPEAWAYTCSSSLGGEGQRLQQQQQLGLWVIAGFLTFLALEKMFLDSKDQEGANQAPSKDPVVAAAALNGGHSLAQPAAEPGLSAVVRSIKVSGYLNLLANTIDNFTHGLAVAASFLVSKKIGLLTTMAILLHEIPHEVGDFAILLRAGFDRWSAAKLQLSTALGGLLGACFAICTQSPKGVEETVAWILPFTSGGFLYIALVNVLPDLLEEDDPWHSLQQVLLLCAGILVMVLFSLFVE